MIDLWWQGLPDNPNSEVKVCVRVNATGTVGLTVNGVRETRNANTAVEDGNIEITIPGLESGLRHGFSLDFNGSDYLTVSAGDERALRTFSASGKYKVAYGSCDALNEPFTHGYVMVERGCDVLALLGDTPYVDTGTRTGLWGEDVVDITTDDSLSNFYAYYRRFFRKTGMLHVMQRMPIVRMWDDHELGGDNWDHSLTQANSGGAGANMGYTTQAEVDAHFSRAQQAFATYSKCNPSNSDSGVAAQAPFQAAAAASNYPAQYFRFTLGDTEYFMTDNISHRGLIGAADRTTYGLADADATMLGTTQKTWFKSAMANSAASNQVWLNTKKTYANINDNGDGYDKVGSGTTWPGFIYERDELVAYFHANCSNYVTVSGDRHSMSIASLNAATDTYNHVMVCACPFGTANVNSQGTGFNTYIKKIIEKANFGIVEETENLNVSIIDYQNKKRWSGDIVGNALVYNQAKVAMG